MSAADPRRQILLELFQAGLARVEGRRCVRDSLVADSPARAQRPVWVAAIGKAAASMALGAYDAIGTSIERSLIITKDGHVAPQLLTVAGVEVLESSHPLPDERSLAAGARLLEWVQQLPEHVDPLFLVSGGSSSLVEVLQPGTTCADLERFTSEGLAAGIAIGELNARRTQHSLIKGGRLTACLQGRPARALFISDVPGDDPAVIGSVSPGAREARARDSRASAVVVASIEHAVDGVVAAAMEFGLAAEPSYRAFDGDVMRLAVRFAHELDLSPVEVRVWGGESTVQLPKSPGRGGRNQHLALAAARLIAGHPDLLLAIRRAPMAPMSVTGRCWRPSSMPIPADLRLVVSRAGCRCMFAWRGFRDGAGGCRRYRAHGADGYECRRPGDRSEAVGGDRARIAV